MVKYGTQRIVHCLPVRLRIWLSIIIRKCKHFILPLSHICRRYFIHLSILKIRKYLLFNYILLCQPCVQLDSCLNILCIQLPELSKCHIQIVLLPDFIVTFIIKGFPLRCKTPFLYLFIFPCPILTIEFDEPGACLIILISWHIHHLLSTLKRSTRPFCRMLGNTKSGA